MLQCSVTFCQAVPTCANYFGLEACVDRFSCRKCQFFKVNLRQTEARITTSQASEPLGFYLRIRGWPLWPQKLTSFDTCILLQYFQNYNAMHSVMIEIT